MRHARMCPAWIRAASSPGSRRRPREARHDASGHRLPVKDDLLLRTARRAARAACAAALAAAALPALAPTPADARGAACAGADEVPAAATLARARTATVCLVNAERARRGLRRLRDSAPLRASAQAYARDMAERDFFAHTSPGGAGLLARVRRTSRYLKGARSSRLGENLAWGAEARATPRAVVSAWMASPSHRANVLSAAFRESGLGLVLGAPVRSAPAGAAVTYAHHFGRRG